MITLQSRPRYAHAMDSVVPHWPAPVSVVTPFRPCFWHSMPGDGGVQLVAAGGVVAPKFIVDLCRRLELFLKAVSSHQRGGRYICVSRISMGISIQPVVVVELLLYKIVAEYGAQIVRTLPRLCRVQQGRASFSYRARTLYHAVGISDFQDRFCGNFMF